MGCSPLLQQLLADPAFQALVARGRAAGSLGFGELNAVAPEVCDPEELADLMDWLDANGIALIDDLEPEPAGEPAAPTIDFDALPDVPGDDKPPAYRHDPAFEGLLRELGVPFADAVASHEPDGWVFDAELIVPGDQALAAWLALRNAAPRTGLWPVIGDEVRGRRYWEDAPAPELLDPGGRTREWFERFRQDRTIPMLWLTTEAIRADAAANIAAADAVPPTPWTFRRHRGAHPAPAPPDGPDDDREPPAPDLAELFSNAGPFRAHKSGGGHPEYPAHPFVRLRLYPTAVPWEVFAYLSGGGWNDCPWPDEHLAMLWHWHRECGAEVVSHLGDWYELFVPRPPRSRHRAERLVQEMSHFGEETFYSHGPGAGRDPVEALRGSHYWYFWWD